MNEAILISEAVSFIKVLILKYLSVCSFLNETFYYIKGLCLKHVFCYKKKCISFKIWRHSAVEFKYMLT